MMGLMAMGMGMGTGIGDREREGRGESERSRVSRVESGASREEWLKLRNPDVDS